MASPRVKHGDYANLSRPRVGSTTRGISRWSNDKWHERLGNRINSVLSINTSFNTSRYLFHATSEKLESLFFSTVLFHRQLLVTLWNVPSPVYNVGAFWLFMLPTQHTAAHRKKELQLCTLSPRSTFICYKFACLINGEGRRMKQKFN